jgi:GT2 family glycosyltransferase
VSRAAIVVPVYCSEETLGAFLAALERQTVQDFETVAVDSSPGEACWEILARCPRVRARRSADRLWPQQARTRGVAETGAPWLVFTDPDVVPAPDWLERLLAAAQSGDPAVGSIGCAGDRWLDRGIHLCKFSKWLPGRTAAEVDMGPTANLCLSHEDFRTIGGFGPERLLGDVELSRRLRALGRRLRFAPGATVEHRHTHTLGSFLGERFWRGIEAGRFRGGLASTPWLWKLSLACTFPLRWLTNLAHCARHAAEAGRLADYVVCFPVLALGFGASVLGESAGLARALAASSRAMASASRRAEPRM